MHSLKHTYTWITQTTKDFTRPQIKPVFIISIVFNWSLTSPQSVMKNFELQTILSLQSSLQSIMWWRDWHSFNCVKWWSESNIRPVSVDRSYSDDPAVPAGWGPSDFIFCVWCNGCINFIGIMSKQWTQFLIKKDINSTF